MEWIQRNPKKAVGLSALAVLVVIIIVWGMAGGSDEPSGGSTLGGAPLATPTTTPSHELSVLPTPGSPGTSVGDVLQALESDGGGSFAGGAFGGTSQSLTKHRVTVTAHSNGPMMAVGWWIPFANGERKGADTSKSRSFKHSDITYGDADLARILAYGGPFSTKTWCTVVVDGEVTERQQAEGPYGQVFCQG